MSSGNQFERLFKLWATVAKLVVDGKRNATKVADMLQSIVDEAQPAYELYLFGKQKTGGDETGFTIEEHLTETKLIDRCFSLEDELVKDWIANPATYPEEFKGKAIVLWKSIRTTGSNREVACLYGGDDRVIVVWRWLGGRWRGNNPALLASS